MFDTPVHRLPYLCAKATAARRRFACEELPIEPSCASCCDLLLQGEIRPNGERQSLSAIRVVIGTRLDNRAGRGITRELKVRELKMVRPAVNRFDDGIGRTLQLIAQPPLNKTPEHGATEIIAMQGKAGDIRIAPTSRHRPMHGFDDVSANAEIPQGLFKSGLQCPTSRFNLLGETEVLQFCHPANHHPAQLRVAVWTAWPQVGDARA